MALKALRLFFLEVLRPRVGSPVYQSCRTVRMLVRGFVKLMASVACNTLETQQNSKIRSLELHTLC